MASHIDTWLGLVGLGLASQASCVYLPRMTIHTATGEASRVYSIILCNNITAFQSNADQPQTGQLHRARVQSVSKTPDIN